MNTTKIIKVIQNNLQNTTVNCIICCKEDSKLININSEYGLKNNLSQKIEKYIPIKLMEYKNLPHECCQECVTNILSWHDFLRRILASNLRDVKLSSDSETVDTLSSTHKILQAFHQYSRNDITDSFLNISQNEDEREDQDHDDSVDFYQHDEKESELYQENKTEIKLQCHSQSEIFTSDNETNYVNPKFSDVSDSDDCGRKIRDKMKGVRTKMDPKIIDDAKVVIGERTYYTCKDCGKSLLSPYTFVWHMRIHTGERPYMCDLCGKLFRVSQGLVRHLKETHKRIKNFPCDLCGRMFATKRNVEEHRRIHTNERPYVCTLCEKSFKQKASLFVHNRTHSNNFPFKCEYCNQCFRTKPPLLIHITKHTGQKPYPCDICGRCFRIKYELKRHKLVHSEEKPFVCSSCGLKFKQKRYLRNHFKTNHTDLRLD